MVRLFTGPAAQAAVVRDRPNPVCGLQDLSSPPAVVSPQDLALLSHGFLFVIADWWQQLQKQ